MSGPPQPLPWSERVRERESEERARFVESHLGLVRYLSVRMHARLPDCVEVDDLVHDGIVGLLDAVDKFDPSRGVLFRSYAESRIRGAILDGLRQKDWRPRSVRHLQRRLDEAAARLASAHRRAPTEEELAAALGVDVEAYRALLQDASSGSLLSLDDLAAHGDADPAGEEDRPDVPLERRDLLRALAEELGRLPERERRVVELYYHEGLTMKEVGAVLGVTESRVCQLHSQAAARLRGALRVRMRPLPPVATVMAGARRER